MTAMKRRTTTIVNTAMRGASQAFWFWMGTEASVPGAGGGAGAAAGGGAGGWNVAGRIMMRVNSPGPVDCGGGGA